MTMQSSFTELSLAVILQRAVMGILVLGCYGFIMTALLNLNGDKGPKHDGRLTLDPFAHLSLLGLAALVISKIGWILPLQGDIRKSRGGVFGYLGCILTAGITMLVLAHAFAALRSLSLAWFSHTSAIYAISLLNIGVDLAIGVGLAALLPIPPFILGRIWYQFWPAAQEQMEKLDISIGCLIVIALLLIPSRISVQIIATVRGLIGI